MQVNTPTAPQGWLAPLLPALAIASFTLVAGIHGLYQAPETGETAVLFAPGTDPSTAMAAIAAAGGKLVGPTRLANVHVAYATDPAFHVRIKQYGGWFTLAAQGLCAPSSRNSI